MDARDVVAALRATAERTRPGPLVRWIRANDARVERALSRVVAQEYRYGAVNRPIGYGTAPKDVLRVEPPVPGERYTRHGVAVYDRPLTEEEVRGYELVPYMPLDRVIAKVLDKLPYRKEYEEAAREGDVGVLRSGLGRRLEDLKVYTDIPLSDVLTQVIAVLAGSGPVATGPPSFPVWMQGQLDEEAALRKSQLQRVITAIEDAAPTPPVGVSRLQAFLSKNLTKKADKALQRDYARTLPWYNDAMSGKWLRGELGKRGMQLAGLEDVYERLYSRAIPPGERAAAYKLTPKVPPIPGVVQL